MINRGKRAKGGENSVEFWDHLQMQLEHKGFCRVENKKNWYWQEENPVLYLICLLDGAEEGWQRGKHDLCRLQEKWKAVSRNFIAQGWSR